MTRALLAATCAAAAAWVALAASPAYAADADIANLAAFYHSLGQK